VPKLLQPGRNVWRRELAQRAALLSDAGQYFGALRKAFIKAQSSIFIIGWDIDSRTRLVGEDCTSDDEYPEGLIDLLSALVKERPKLAVHLLVWDYSLLYAVERELFPHLSIHWRTPRRVRYCLDDDLPLGASHHQKIVTIDDTVAFCGGLDLTMRRWDTRQHQFHEPGRVDVAGVPYPPFHDVQAVVDGTAALALAELARERWRRGACERAPALRPAGDPWPDGVAPDLTAIDVGIARTFPETENEKEIREVEALHFDMIDSAERTIYIENQYLTSLRFAEHVARRLKARSELEMLVVTPKAAHSWLEERTMQGGLARCMRLFQSACAGGRVGLFYPEVECDGNTADTMVHSKVMVVDDRLLRVGSANLNNRSLGLDSECDLAFEASTDTHRQAIVRMRDSLIGHFCGVTQEAFAASLAKRGSLIEAASSVSNNGHRLKPIESAGTFYEARSKLEQFADAERPVPPPEFLKMFVGERPRARRIGRVAKVVGFGLLIVLLILLWRFTPLAAMTHPTTIRDWFASFANTPMAPAIVLGVFIVAGLLAFPVTVLIAATAATFGPWLGFVYAAAGALASAIVAYGVGALAGREALEDVLGPRLNRVRRTITRRGMLAVAAIRMVPVAPFTLINLVAGASKIPLLDYVLGTVFGMLPGLVVISLLGSQIVNILTEPTLANILLLVLAVAAWIGVSLGAQALVTRVRSARK
jgi:phosphatidylserine/phosphatidylglycerophosphate/cardiolipin synthase-like enzyme/uncharacterized membrane protein YdjX (TVP38/TMEM64 family)